MRRSGFFVSAFVMDVALGMCMFAVPLFAKNVLGADPFQIGIVGMNGTLGYICACIFFGTVSEHVGRKPTILGGVILFTATYFLVARSQALWQLYILMIFSGVSMGMYWPPLEAAIADDTARHELGRRIGFFNIAWSGGIAVGTVLAGPVYDYGKLTAYGHRFPFHVAVASCPLVFLLVLLTIPWRGRHAGRAESKESGAKARPPDPVASAYRTMAWISNFSAWVVLSVMRYLFAQDVEHRLQLSGRLIAALVGSISAAQVMMFILLMFTVFWRRNFRFFLLSQAVLAAGALVICLFESPAVLLVGCCCLGSGIGVTYCSSICYSLEGSATAGSHAGVHETMLGLGILCGPIVGGWLARTSGDPRLAYAFCVCAILAAMLIEIVIYRRRIAMGRLPQPAGDVL